jgi:HEAT repeat protein
VELSENDFTLDFTAIFSLSVDDLDERIRIKSVEGLGLEDKQAYVRPIIKALQTDESEEVRSAAAGALGKFALMAENDELPEGLSDDIFNALLGMLENSREPVSVRRRALESISAFQREPVGQYIEDFYYSDDAAVKASAIYAMGRNCKTSWLNYLIDEMQSGTAEFRYEAAQASGELEDEEAVPYLIDLVEDDDHEVQEAAIVSLGKIGGEEARQFLKNITGRDDPRIREAAKAALTGLTACEDPLSLNF